MKQLIYLLPLFLSTWGFSQTFLNRGDVMVLGVNSNNSCAQDLSAVDIIYLVFFKDITNSTQIFITDNGYNGSTFKTTEGVISLTRNGGILPAGTLVKININENGSGVANGWNVQKIGTGTFNLNTNSDQFFVYKNNSNPTTNNLLQSFNTKRDWLSNNNSENSLLPSTLVCNHQSLELIENRRYRYYNGPTTSISEGEWQVRIYNSTRWETSLTNNEAGCSNFNNNFNLTSISIKTSIDEQTLCVSDVASPLSVINESNVVNYQWYVNTTPSTIGATAVGTNSFQYTPPTTTVGTYYYYCVMKINLPLNGVSNTTDCEFISNFYKVNVTANPATSPIISL